MTNSIEIEVNEVETIEVVDIKEVVVKDVVLPPNLQDKQVTPTIQGSIIEADEGFDGLLKVTVNPIETEELNIIPTIKEQIKEGLYSKVTIAGDENLKAENISKGTSIFGVEGTGNIVELSTYFEENLTSTMGNYILNQMIKKIDFPINTTKITNMQNMFYNCHNLTSIDLTNINTDKVTNMQSMFSNCRSLTKLDLSKFNTSKVTNTSYMFQDCKGLTSLDLTNLDMSSVTNCNYMFYRCDNLTEIHLGKFGSEKLNTGSMFYECKSLEELDLSCFEGAKPSSLHTMFCGCTKLKSLDVSYLDTSNIKEFYRVFYDCNSLEEINVGLLNVNSATSFNLIFDGCESLSDDSLNSIMRMCINAANITSSKTLKSVGLTKEQSMTCQTLSNYQEFIEAGWTTGY